jgi:starch synthase
LNTIARERFPRSASVFTIHNLAYQGNFPFEQWDGLLLNPSLRATDGLEFFSKFSHLKGGIAFSDVVTTVSPTYANEIQTSEFGFGMDGLLRHRSQRLTGITNGIDTRTWDPASDQQLICRFSKDDFREQRLANKRALRERAGFPGDEKSLARPLIAMIGRLTEQKGFDLLVALAEPLAERGVDLAFLAAPGSHELELPLRLAAERRPENVAAFFGFDEHLAHTIFGGADMVVVPSRFEPCGLTQMYAMRYGAVPVVRSVGGLADTVVDATPATLEDHTATGFAFHSPTPDALAAALARALRAYESSDVWTSIQRTGLAQDWSWDHVAGDYAAVYERAVALQGA